MRRKFLIFGARASSADKILWQHRIREIAVPRHSDLLIGIYLSGGTNAGQATPGLASRHMINGLRFGGRNDES